MGLIQDFPCIILFKSSFQVIIIGKRLDKFTIGNNNIVETGLDHNVYQYTGYIECEKVMQNFIFTGSFGNS